MRASTFLALILCNLVWSLNPVAGKILIADVGGPAAAWFRYSSALVFYLIISRLRILMKDPTPGFFWPKENSAKRWLLILGLFTFCWSPFFNLIGLSYTRATDGALLIAMEPMITLLVAWVIARERLRADHFVAFALAVFGFCLLSGLTPGRIQEALSSDLIYGNALIVCSLIGEGMYSACYRKVQHLAKPASIFGTVLTIGVFGLTVGIFLAQGGVDFGLLSPKGALAAAYLGLFGTTLSYLFWLVILKHASLASMVLTLFAQPLAGALWGWLFLGDHLGVVQWLGGLLILTGMVIPSLIELRAAGQKIKLAL